MPGGHGVATFSAIRHNRSIRIVGLLPALQSLLSFLTVALFIMTFTVQPIRIPSASMEPTLLTGDFLLMNRQSTSSDQTAWMPPTGIHRGDLVVFHDPIDDPAVHLVKRVIGLPGDRIHLHGNLVYLNGRPLAESYAVYRSAAPDSYRDDFPNLSAMDARVDTSWWIRMGQLGPWRRNYGSKPQLFCSGR